MSVTHQDLLQSVELCCVDGRKSQPIVGSPGGSIGELIVVVGAMESSCGELSTEVLKDLLGHIHATGCIVYHHTDVSHMTRLSEALAERGCSGWEEGSFLDWLSSPPHESESHILELIVRPEHVGCGHIKAMLSSPIHYGIRRALVEHTIRTFFQRLWSGDTRVHLDVLEGNHEEQSVLVVPSCGGSSDTAECMPIAPKNKTSSFVFHPDAAQCVRGSMMRAAQAIRPCSDRSVEDLMVVANELANRQLDATLDQLASGLERVELDPCSMSA